MTTSCKPNVRGGSLAAVPESKLLADVRELGRRYGWLTYHTYDSRRCEPGFPDLVLVHGGQRRLIFAELKTMSGRTTPAQDTWLSTLTAIGVETYLWRPDDLALITRVLRVPREAT